MARARRTAAKSRGVRARRSPVERLRAICLALPEATEKIAWGEPTWRVGGRLFWVGVRLDRRPDWTVVAGLVAQAYRQVASPRLLRALEASGKGRR
jgi:predicted DNA-binding protein (MmcQ/YjbR family)